MSGKTLCRDDLLRSSLCQASTPLLQQNQFLGTRTFFAQQRVTILWRKKMGSSQDPAVMSTERWKKRPRDRRWGGPARRSCWLGSARSRSCQSARLCGDCRPWTQHSISKVMREEGISCCTWKFSRLARKQWKVVGKQQRHKVCFCSLYTGLDRIWNMEIGDMPRISNYLSLCAYA